MTNADRIRAMTDEELAKWILNFEFIDHKNFKSRFVEWLYWLKSPVEVET